MRILGIDPGRRRIGLALTDETGRLALPLRTLEAGPTPDDTIAALVEEIRAREVGRVVIGLPLQLDGGEGIAARRARAFGARLGRRIEEPIVFWDERLTTAMAERSLAGLGLRARDRRRVVDQSAAALLLQSYVDAKVEARWPIEADEADAVDGPAPAPRSPGGGRRGGRRRGRGR